MVAYNLVMFIVSCAVLAVCGIFLVKNLSKIARFLHLSEFVAGFIIMAISTSLPELFVGIRAALNGIPSLSLGNVIGSNIADITLVAGIAIIHAKNMKYNNEHIGKSALWMIALSALPMVLYLIGNQLSRIDGVVLVLVFFAYYYKLSQHKCKHILKNNISRWEIVISSASFVVLLLVLFKTSEYVVDFGSALALDLSLPPLLIGLFFLALGTSMPELVFETSAMVNRKPDFALGDVIGSVICNSTLILGVTAIIMPISASFMPFITSAIFMITVVSVFAAFIQASSKLTYMFGISLVLLYVFFIIVELSLKGVVSFA